MSTTKKSPVMVIMKPRRVFALINAPAHKLHGQRVEITGHGRGWDVYAIPADGGVELVFRSDEIAYEARS